MKNKATLQVERLIEKNPDLAHRDLPARLQKKINYNYFSQVKSKYKM